jgi:pimeloyl-ACP methyl ester carboxylesterase
VIGHSLGGTAGLMACARGVAAAGVVALSPMPSFDFALRSYARGFGLNPKLRERLARRLEARIGLRREDFDLARLRPELPVLLVHDLLDRAVPARHTRALRESWPSATLFETIGFGHNRGLQAKHVSRAIVAFLLSLPGEQFDEPAAGEGADEAPSSSLSDAT